MHIFLKVLQWIKVRMIQNVLDTCSQVFQQLQPTDNWEWELSVWRETSSLKGQRWAQLHTSLHSSTLWDLWELWPKADSEEKKW